MRKNMNKIYNIVLQLLEENPETRSSDKELIVQTLERMDFDVNMPFYYVMENSPNLESITRARRKAQEKYPRLSAKPKVEEYRAVNQIDMAEWAVTH